MSVLRPSFAASPNLDATALALRRGVVAQLSTAAATAVAAPATVTASVARSAQPPAPAAAPTETTTSAQAAWLALDEPDAWHSFSRPLPEREGWWESHLAIGGMHCAACTLAVEDALRRVPGVDGVQVSGASATARVIWSPAVSRPSQWWASLARAGYEGLPAGDMLAAVPRLQARRLMLWRWLVAGFCMMQVMMYALPAYVAGPGEMSSEAQALLRWASWTLTLPVVLFSCWPFFLSALRDLRRGCIGMDVPVALGIAMAFVASSVATAQPDGPWGREVWYDSLTMFVFFLLTGRMLEQRLRDRTAGALEALMRRLPATVERRGQDGTFARVPVHRLVVGDVVRVLPGDVFPADGTVCSGQSQVDEALLTGESRPVRRSAGDAVVAGSCNLSGVLQVQVESVGRQTRYAAIVALMEQASLDKPQLAQLADRVASPFLMGVLLAAAGAAAWWWSEGPAHAIGVAVAVLIVTCPCALSLATPAALLAAAGALARQGVLVRRLQALESGSLVDTVVFDKTGTLTQERMTVRVRALRNGADRTRVLAMGAALARHSLHPASRAVAQADPLSAWTASDVHELAGRGLRGTVSGADGSRHAMVLGSALLCAAPSSAQPSECLQVHLADERGWLASFELDETLRADAPPAIAALRALGLRVQLLSGDQQLAVSRLGWRAGIEWCLGERTPQGKLAHVRALQAAGRRVAMVGDGMNDGPVLALSDLSIAMGQAVPLAQARSDFVVLGGQLSAVSALLLHARRTRIIVRQNLLWAATYNAVCVPLAVMGLMPPWLAGLGMAASSLLVIANAARLAKVKNPMADTAVALA